MSQDLLSIVEDQLLPQLSHLGFTVVGEAGSNSFDNAEVELRSPSLALRVVRERSRTFADLGPASDPGAWFDSAVVVDYLGLSARGGVHDPDVTRAMKAIAAFVNACYAELSDIFAPENRERTERELMALRDKRARRMFDG